MRTWLFLKYDWPDAIPVVLIIFWKLDLNLANGHWTHTSCFFISSSVLNLCFWRRRADNVRSWEHLGTCGQGSYVQRKNRYATCTFVASSSLFLNKSKGDNSKTVNLTYDWQTYRRCEYKFNSWKRHNLHYTDSRPTEYELLRSNDVHNFAHQEHITGASQQLNISCERLIVVTLLKFKLYSLDQFQ